MGENLTPSGGDASFSEMIHHERPRYAGFWIRTLASFVDTALLLVVIFPLFLAIYPSESGDHFISYVVTPVIVFIFWVLKQATPGKMVVSVKIVDAKTGRPPTKFQYVVRYLGYYVSMLPFGLGFLWVAFDPKKQGWHDKIARTLVIYKQN